MNDNDLAFDQILNHIGDNGKYQRYLLLFFLCPLHFLAPFLTLTQLFQISLPDHWCHVSGRPENVSIEQWKMLTIPTDEEENGSIKFSKCKQYENVLFNSSKTSAVIECQNGWDYDNTYYDLTLSMQENWVCQKDHYSAMWLSTNVAGSVIGTFICNSLSDMVGRKPIVLLTTMMYGIFGILRVYAESKTMHFALSFLSATAWPAALDVSFILVMEQVSGVWRARTTFLTFFTWTIGMSILPLIAWLCRNWITLGLITSSPFLVYIFVYRFFNESPRWLASRGRISEALVILKKISKINGVQLPEHTNDVLLMLKKHKKSSILEDSFIQLLSYPTLRKRTLLLTMTYVCDNLIYYGLLYNNENMVGNEFLNFFFFAITEFPSNFLGWSCSQIIGRRITSTGFIAISTIIIFIVLLLPASSGIVSTALLITTKAIINVSFFVIYLQFVEIYPTSHRSSGTGFSTIIVTIVGIGIPFIVYSRSYWTNLPLLIFCVIGVLGFISSLCLPETLGAPLPQNIEEGEVHLINQKFWSYHGKRWKSLRSSAEERAKINITDI